MNRSATMPDCQASQPVDVDILAARFRDRTAKIGVIGLGHVGLPLLRTAAERGLGALGFDLDGGGVERLDAGGWYVGDICADSSGAVRCGGRLAATDDFSRLGEGGAVI